MVAVSWLIGFASFAGANAKQMINRAKVHKACQKQDKPNQPPPRPKIHAQSNDEHAQNHAGDFVRFANVDFHKYSLAIALFDKFVIPAVIGNVGIAHAKQSLASGLGTSATTAV